MQYITSPRGAGLQASLAPHSHRRFFKKFFKEKNNGEMCASMHRPAAIRRRVLRVLSLCTVRMRLNEHSACKVGGVFQNKHRFSASVMYARGRTHWNSTPTPSAPHLLAPRSFVTIGLAGEERKTRNGGRGTLPDTDHNAMQNPC